MEAAIQTDPAAEFDAAPYDFAEVRTIADELGLAEPVAIALVRRGFRTAASARQFLAAEERHDWRLFSGIDDAVALIVAACREGRRITVHGDYDVDGMAATALAVGALRGFGADCDWVIPDRLADGYGLNASTIGGLGERGTTLLISVDCGITSVAEVELARSLGIEVVVTDHHTPAAELPDCPIVHPVVGGYPFAGLCGTAVAAKLIEGVTEALGAPARADADLDIVALATVADMVPLLGENRSLVRRGLAAMRRRPRPGLAALMEVSKVEPEHVDESDIGFRLAPRLNAAGRLYRADAGVELLLTADRDRAAEIARELDAANYERREIEREVLNAAETALRELPDEERSSGIVLAGEGWHPGVVGIVASRIAERHDKPAVLIALEAGRGRGSGRSRGDFDLLAALQACAPHLERFGGHRAAAGLEIAAARIGDFRRAFVEHANRVTPAGAGKAPERVDAIVGAEALGLDVAEQLRRLGPFGMGNPSIRLLVPWARLSDVRPMGEEGAHARFSLQTGSSRAQGVAFRTGEKLAAAGERPHDLTLALELNHWNGSVEPRAVLGRARRVDPLAEQAADGTCCSCGRLSRTDSFWTRFEAALGPEHVAPAEPISEAGQRAMIHAHGTAIVARISELVSSGAPTLVVCADAARRAELALLAAAPSRFGGRVAVACRRCADESLSEAAAEVSGGPALLLTDWQTLLREPQVAHGFPHLVAVDPPSSEAERAVALRAATTGGYFHAVWGPPELEHSARVLGEEWQPRRALAEIYRAARADELAGEGLRRALAGDGRYARAAEIAARCVLVLGELGLAELGGTAAVRTLRVVSSERTELERSSAWRRFANAHEERLRFLRDQKQT